MAEAERLNPYSDLALIDRIATRYAKDPDDIFEKSFNFVQNLTIMWREQDLFQDRYREALRELQPKQAQN